MIHRNTMIATPAELYIGDDKSCKVIDAATGKLLDEIVPPRGPAGGTFWKWMALEDGVLYAMMGEQEQARSDQAVEVGQARLALGPDLGGLEPAREPLGLRPQRPGDRPRDEEGPLEPSRGGADRRPGHLHEPRPHLRLPLRRLPCLSRRQDRPGALAQDAAECPGAVRRHRRVPESPGLADQLADHRAISSAATRPCTSPGRRIGKLLAVSAAGRQRPLGASLQQLPARPARRRASTAQRPDRQAPEHEVRLR